MKEHDHIEGITAPENCSHVPFWPKVPTNVVLKAQRLPEFVQTKENTSQMLYETLKTFSSMIGISKAEINGCLNARNKLQMEPFKELVNRATDYLGEHKIRLYAKDATGRPDGAPMHKIDKNLELRGVKVDQKKTELERRLQLKEILLEEDMFDYYQRYTDGDSLCQNLWELMVCVLHLQNRTSEKMIKLLWHYTATKLYTNKKVAEAQLARLIDYIKTTCSALHYSSCTFSLSFASDSKFDTLDKFTLDGGYAKKLFRDDESVTGLILALIPPGDDGVYNVEHGMIYEVLVNICNQYVDVMHTMKQHEDFDKITSLKLQTKIDSLMGSMKKVFGNACISNYFHHLDGGEIYYLIQDCEHKNVYKYCNEGTEAINSVFQATCSRKTNKIDVIPQMKKISLRSIWWKAEFSFEEFKQLREKIRDIEKGDEADNEVKLNQLKIDIYRKTFKKDSDKPMTAPKCGRKQKKIRYNDEEIVSATDINQNAEDRVVFGNDDMIIYDNDDDENSYVEDTDTNDITRIEEVVVLANTYVDQHMNETEIFSSFD
jgi:hypothetical protein